MDYSQYCFIEGVCMKSKNICTVIIIVLLPTVLIAQSENWVYNYNGSGNQSDGAFSIVYGDDGNLYAAGYSTGSSTSRDFTVISLTSAGDTNWTYRYNGPGNGLDRANSIVHGDDGNLYAAGYSAGTGTSSDFTVISLTTMGDTNWIYRYDGSGSSADEANSIIYGDDGNLYAAGYSTGSSTANDFTIISLTTTGDTNWTYRYDGSGSSLDNDKVRSIVYGADGNIYAAGCSDEGSTSYDFFVISITSAGDTNWTYKYNGASGSNSFDEALSIMYGSDENIYAAGYSRGSTTGYDFFIISFTSVGDTNWTYRYDGPANGIDGASSILYDNDSTIYASGYSQGSGTGNDLVVISLTTAGDTNWTYRYDGPGSNSDVAYSIVHGDDGNLYVAGNSTGSGTATDFTIISLTTTGESNWIYRYDGPGIDADNASSIVYGDDGNIYAAGNSTGSDTDKDFTVISLETSIGMSDVKTVSIDIPSNIPEDSTLYPTTSVANLSTYTVTFPVSCEIEPATPPYISIDTIICLSPGDTTQITFPDEFTFVSGTYTVTVYTQLAGDENPENDTLVKLILTYDPGTAEGGSDMPTAFMFSAPTISNNETNITLVLYEMTKVDILVYDVVGKLSKTLVSEIFPAGMHSIPVILDLPAGVYFYNLNTGSDRNIIKKFVIIN
jgi:uncharacterized delta-60 repeat protein